jgi:SHS2 domain-containing protein
VTFDWVEHTGEIELTVEACSAEQVLAEATVAVAQLLGRGGEGVPVVHELVVDATDRPALLVAWLEELVFLAETEAFVPERIVGIEMTDHHTRGSVEGRQGRPSHLVKAVTYHDLVFKQSDGGWRAQVVLDV